MSKKECKHEGWNPCGNDFYSCRKCGILRTSQQVNLYAEKDRQIADLEAKLAESEKRIELADCIIKQYADKDKNLYLQLAEKEKEIEQWKSIAERSSSVLDRFNYCGESIIYNTTREQDKISFAVEQLEKVKEYADIDYRKHCYIDAVQLDKYIDNQIEELKKEMK